MKKFAPNLFLLFSILAFFSYSALENNLWTVSYFKSYQDGSLTAGQLSTSPVSHPHASVLQARIAMSEEDYPLALHLIEPIVPSTDPVVLQTYAELLFSLERYTEALDIWHGLGMYNKIEHAARVFNSLDMLDFEILAWEKAYDIYPDMFRSLLTDNLLIRANKFRDSGQYMEAIPFYENLIERFPDSAEPFGELAWAYLLMDETKLALSTINKAMPIGSSNYQFYMRAGSIYEQIEDFDHALAAYQEVLQISPGNFDATQAINRITNP